MSDVIEHKCPCCGGTLQFDVDSQKIKCPYCDSEFDVKEMMGNEDLSQNYELASNAGEEWDEAEMGMMSEYQCESCGGDIYTDADTTATLCPYCGSAVILKGRLSGVLKPDKVIPFKRTKDEALNALKEHCQKSWFIPKRFIENNKLEEIKGLYAPFWVYDAELFADIRFTGVNERRYKKGDSEYVERKYYDVRRAGDIAFDHVPADGSSKIPDDLMESIEPFDYNQVEDFNTGYLSGYVADKYDIDQDQVRPRVKQRMTEGSVDAFRTTVHYDEVSVRGTDVKAKSSNVDYVLYPVWLMNTKWEDRNFSFAMNGQTGKIVGNLPWDLKKLFGVIAIIIIAITTLATVIWYCSEGEFSIGALAVGALIGIVISAIVYAVINSKLKNVKFEHGASNYYRPGSMVLRISSDNFVRKEVRKIN
ncbi:MAG: hypothetical protein IJT54_07640 [Candidatus Methanomethylophilaceae archaeon]|nr:hypothetical protein [Candidatus Methanomethylophilaceae archaeon]